MDALGVVVAELIEAGGRGTRTRLADHLGVNKSTVSRWADGQTPERSHWAGIEAFLGKDAGFLGAEGQNVSRRLAALRSRDARASSARRRSAATRLSSVRRSMMSGSGSSAMTVAPYRRRATVRG